MSNIYNKIRNILLLNVKDTLIKQKSIYLDDDVAEMDILDDSFFEDESYLNHDYNIKKFLTEFSDPCDVIKYHDPKKVRDLIDKMTIWWEFKYPNIILLMSCLVVIVIFLGLCLLIGIILFLKFFLLLSQSHVIVM